MWIFLFLLLWGNIFAQETVWSGWNTDITTAICSRYDLSLEGEQNLKQWEEYHYTLQVESEKEMNKDPYVTYELWQWEQLLTSGEGTSLVYTFDKAWEYLVKMKWTLGTTCSHEAKYSIHVYEKIYTYIWPSLEELTLAHEGMAGSWIYIKEFIIENGTTPDQLTKILADNVYYLKYADILFLESSVVSPFFETLVTLQQLIWFTIHDLDLYVLADINQSAFRRMLARYHNVMWLEKIYVIEKQYIGSLFTSLFLNKDISTLSFVKTYAVSLAYSNKFLIISYLVDYLLQHEFPIGTLLFVLILPFLVLIISLSRQVIGLSIFGVFNPLLFAFSLHIIGIPLTLIFFVAAFLATIFMRIFTKKIYLLYSAKISLLVVLYSILSLGALWAVNYFGWAVLDYNLFQNTYIIFPFLFLIMVGDRVFSEKFYLFDKGWWIGLLEFFLVSVVLYQVMSSLRVQNILLWYPELSLLSILILVLIGRFTWLQLLEYIRFMPLIKHYFEEEE